MRALLLLLLMGCASTPAPTFSDRLGEARTLADLSHLMGSVPACVPASADSQVCSWRRERAVERYSPRDHQNVERRDVLEVVCDLPMDGGARVPTSCSYRSFDAPICR